MEDQHTRDVRRHSAPRPPRALVALPICHEAKLGEGKPIRNVKIPSGEDAVRIHVISPEEEKEYFSRAAKNQNLNDLARLMRSQGMRPEEVVSIRKQDVDLERGQLHIPFGKPRRHVELWI
jgi:integrase